LLSLRSEIDNKDVQLAAADQKKLDELVGKIIVPLQLACESRQYSLMVMALDCFQVPTSLVNIFYIFLLFILIFFLFLINFLFF
jgi:hypothetical protein